MSFVVVAYQPIYRAFLCLAVVLASGCSSERSYDVRGRVAGFSDDGGTLIVEHETVPGLMSAMTMPFDVRDTTAVGALRVGDAVAFELVIVGSQSWIRNLERLPDSEVATHPAGQPDRSQPGAAPLLDPGDPIPDVELVTHADTTLKLSDLQGRRVLLTFIYTLCPMPDFCPLMSRQFAQLQPRLSEVDGPPVHLLSVSFDPANDTPKVLRSYADRYTDDRTNWTFATGDPAAIQRLAAHLGMFYDGGTDQIVHNLVTVLVDSEGTIQHIWRGGDWRPADVLDVLDCPGCIERPSIETPFDAG